MKSISKFTQLQLPCVSPNSPKCGLPVCTITACKCITTVTRSRPQSVYLVLKNMLWWNGGASRQKTNHQQCAAPRMASEANCWDRGSALRQVVRRLQDMMGYPAIINHTHWVDLWMCDKSAWGTTQIACINKSFVRVCGTRRRER